MRRLFHACMLALLSAAALGCPAGGLRTGRPIATLEVQRIAASRTTKAELFAILGAPTAIAGAGEQVTAPAVSVRASVEGKGPSQFLQGGSYPLQGDALLELFPDAPNRRQDLRVYYYAAARESGYFFMFPIFFGAEGYRNHVDELYVLVDERTERVERVVHRPAR